MELIQELRDLDDLKFTIWLENTNKLDQIYTKEDLYWQQRSKINWLLKDDLNTKFFIP
jgi:hypothetical protein